MTSFSYQRFFELSTDMLCIANMDGYFVEVNQAFSKVLGYSKAQLLGQPFIAFVHPGDVDATLREMALNREKGESTLNFTNRYLHRDGHYLTFSWCAQVDHEHNLIYAVARDITETLNNTIRLKQIERALSKESILAITDTKGVIQDVNKKFCEISGYSKEELVGQTHSIINSGFHSQDFFSGLWRTISSGQIWSGLIRNQNKSGGYYYVQTIITPITDHEGHVTSYLAIRHDITESIEVSEDLAKTLEILNETSAIAKVGGWELEVESGELTWTDETFRILEVEKKNGQKPLLPEGLQLFISEHQPIIEEAVNRAIELGEPYSLELQAQTAKGNVLWVYTNGKANYRNGKIVSLSGTIQDIDERKKVEQRFELERQKSIQSAKLASLGELAASMAHEINNPLGIISGYTELMMYSPSIDQNTYSKLGTVLKSCERISHIVSNLKRFSRQDEQQAHIEKSLADIVSEAISLTRPRLKNERVDIEYSGENGLILCSEIEIEQVVLNLINNAIDAVKTLPEKWIKISQTQNEGVVELRVMDSGTGIPSELHQKIFSPFFTTKQIGEGTGLGLSIIEGILNDHGATIQYEKDCSNTCFVIRFPVSSKG